MNWRAVAWVVLFSAYAEVFLQGRRRKECRLDFSLPTQRCFSENSWGRFLFSLFSAYAEVFPTRASLKASRSSFLCLRRGVSPVDWAVLQGLNFSLPTQRCFLVCELSRLPRILFSAYAEVFL